MKKLPNELTWLKALLKDLGFESDQPITMHCDNNAAINIATNSVFHKRIKQIEVDCHKVREKIEEGVILPCHTPSKDQLADIFTKAASPQLRKVQYAVAQFTDYALTWWDRLEAEQRRNRDRPITVWEVLKVEMRRRYVPLYYHRKLQKKFRRLTQGARTVEEYFEEFEHLRNRLQVEDLEESLMAQFLDGLQDRIARKVERRPYQGFEELLHLSVQIESQIKKKNASTSRTRAQGVPSWSPNASTSNRPQEKPKATGVDTRFKPR
ncbi:PREDICTED: uncharacterized protein LOC109126964 [Camelina sativa]|uniref:Uncharacterized protein LOC109126964 n=1 Tax=Camelina sativa TaxID=90675 RepID=A0ABM1QID0_CAMSA|nr:PREDICTED: uncharacterized protein LOC109126964 [Camelina sativa]